ncbi:MAG TPA: nitroreductase family protein [Pilimelia sp.]|nr:nitroreductase family protein [Pilimelia sp.]
MPELHPLLATRWSPRAFDPVAELTPAEVASLLEAARWAPSLGNSQPWRFVVGLRDSESHKRILVHLPDADQGWAGAAAALMVAAHLTVGADGAPLPRAAYDLGQAVAHLTVQASALGLYAHQLAGVDAEALRAELDLPAELAIPTVVAVGGLGNPAALPAGLRERELALRDRRPVTELVLA